MTLAADDKLKTDPGFEDLLHGTTKLPTDWMTQNTQKYSFYISYRFVGGDLEMLSSE